MHALFIHEPTVHLASPPPRTRGKSQQRRGDGNPAGGAIPLSRFARSAGSLDRHRWFPLRRQFRALLLSSARTMHVLAFVGTHPSEQPVVSCIGTDGYMVYEMPVRQISNQLYWVGILVASGALKQYGFHSNKIVSGPVKLVCSFQRACQRQWQHFSFALL